MLNIQPATHPLQKALTNRKQDINKTVLRPWNYTTESLHKTENRNVDLGEDMLVNKEKSAFSEIFDDFNKKEFINDSLEKKFKKHLLSTDSYKKGGGGSIDQIIVNVKEDIKTINDKLHKIRKQQIVHMTNEDFDSKDMAILHAVDKVLIEFGSIKL